MIRSLHNKSNCISVNYWGDSQLLTWFSDFISKILGTRLECRLQDHRLGLGVYLKQLGLQVFCPISQSMVSQSTIQPIVPFHSHLLNIIVNNKYVTRFTRSIYDMMQKMMKNEVILSSMYLQVLCVYNLQNLKNDCIKYYLQSWPKDIKVGTNLGMEVSCFAKRAPGFRRWGKQNHLEGLLFNC